VGTAVAGVTALAASTMGFLRGKLAIWERVLLGVGAVALIFPDLVSDGFGLLVLLFIFFRTAPQKPGSHCASGVRPRTGSLEVQKDP